MQGKANHDRDAQGIPRVNVLCRWYYTSGCHSYYCGDTGRFRAHYYRHARSRARYRS
jgi:hypothetical protein